MNDYERYRDRKPSHLQVEKDVYLVSNVRDAGPNQNYRTVQHKNEVNITGILLAWPVQTSLNARRHWKTGPNGCAR